ncbi:ABC transporter permease [Solitalea koreensis]|uniref:ABC-2 type transport system permease protein n=1 Tax=Solitalea koreensis TaxID=543615 RepID=A0A521D2L2_9SPHI|nr:ABC transporter permease [Solitalea koreensis]SMO65935.1 ABC-2 type transport system permease protein [Solitalea koreensis]
MNKILLIISREYLSRVKKKSFIIMTFLVPLIIMAMYGLIGYLILKGNEISGPKNVIVIDESGVFKNKLTNDAGLNFTYLNISINEAKKNIKTDGNNYLLYIPKFEGNDLSGVELFSEKQAGFSVTGTIEKQLEYIIHERRLIQAGIDEKLLSNLKTNIVVDTKKITSTGEEEGSSGAAFGIGLACSILIYMFIFIYGVQVMRGVIEEKTNRIVEVVISSVKPFQLMMGKIIGIALVGLTQFLLWVVLSTTVTTVISKQLMPKTQLEQLQKAPIAATTVQHANNGTTDVLSGALKAIETINFPLIIGCFLFYFLGGYLLYSAFFAAIGSAVDSETETQQFMLPVTMPLIFAFIFSINFVVNNPDSPISFWMSMIPLFSPVVMMVRIPFGVPTWEIILSMGLLVAGFFLTVWLAAKIYRTGILMYGKRASWKELGKWLFYK